MSKVMKFLYPDIQSMSGGHTPDIQSMSGGYIFFDSPSIHLLVCLSVNFTSKFCVKPLLIAHISVTTYPKVLKYWDT